MEIWKDIKGYEGCYQVSDLGRVKSISRFDSIGRLISGRVLKQKPDKHGYCRVRPFNNGIGKTKKVHQLVAEHFLNHNPDGTHKLVVNHKDFNKQNNNVKNLEIVTQRENGNMKHLKEGRTSIYTGVWFRKDRGNWKANIRINNKTKHLGTFDNEYDAHLAYEKVLKEINN